MAKTKSDLFDEAQAAGLVPDDAEADDYTGAQLESLLRGDIPVPTGPVPTSPVVAPDGHVTLSQEDLDARNA